MLAFGEGNIALYATTPNPFLCTLYLNEICLNQILLNGVAAYPETYTYNFLLVWMRDRVTFLCFQHRIELVRYLMFLLILKLSYGDGYVAIEAAQTIYLIELSKRNEICLDKVQWHSTFLL